MPPGYILLQNVRSTPQSEVCFALRETEDHRQFVLKTYPGDAATDAKRRAERELEALHAVAGAGVPVGIELVETSGTPILVQERVPGIHLEEWCNTHPSTPETWLQIAIQLSDVLARVHAAHWLHRDVTPQNVLVNPETLQTHLIDFGFARRVGATSDTPGVGAPLWAFAGTLQYIAPEQTGRMNRGIDARSDLYGLGATLYFALVGQPPFEAQDPLALIHAHMAIPPRPPHELRPDIPNPLSQIVLKLLQKEPSDRYQSARALAEDLRRFQQALVRGDELEQSFPLGTSETPDRPHFLPKLYGRAPESERLRELCAGATEGSIRALMLSGEPGAGKSALVDTLRRQLAQSGGYLAIGKFELSVDRPYAAWSAALGTLVHQLLVESDARLQTWRQDLCAGLGNVAGALLDLVPDLSLILGSVPAVPPLGPRETQSRLSLALQRFLTSCATPEHPLVIFLDDLQWSDAASRFLLEDLLSGGTQAALLLIGAYRAGDVHADHPVARSLHRLRERGVPVEIMHLGSLSPQAALDMLAEALNHTPLVVSGLAKLIERKTANSPLFVRQFIDHIHGRGLLRYTHDAGWTWNLAELESADIPEGAVALIAARISDLQEQPRRVLQLASCVGDEFGPDLLSELAGREQSAVEEALFALCDAGLLAPCPAGFRFVHDRIREGAQQLLAPEARARLHYEMTRLLLARIAESEWPRRALEIAEHLNRGLACLPDELRLVAIRINLAAGKQALAAGASATSEAHLAVARRLFQTEDWQDQAALGFDLHLQSAESAFLNQKFEAALERLDTLEKRPTSLMEFAQIAAKRLQVFALTKREDECIEYLLSSLRRFGLRWPAHPSRLRVRFALYSVAWRLRGCEREGFLRPQREIAPRWIGPLLLIRVSSGVLMRTDIHLPALMNCWNLSLIIRRGYVAAPGFSLATYASWLQLILGDRARSERLQKISRRWNEQVPHPQYSLRSELVLCAGPLPWSDPRRSAVDPLERIAENMLEVGDVEHAFYCRFLKAIYRAMAGDRLPESEKRLGDIADAVRRAGYLYHEPERCHRVLRAFCAADGSAGSLAEEVRASDAWLAENPGSVATYVRTLWMMLLCIQGRFDLALSQSEQLGERLYRSVPYVHVADHTFYRGLAAAALATGETRGPRRRLFRALDASSRCLARWARSGPDFSHMALFLAAERARLRGEGTRALNLYERSSEAARKQEFHHHAALALERRARTLLQLRRTREARAAFAAAAKRYREWGAAAKTIALEQEMNSLVT